MGDHNLFDPADPDATQEHSLPPLVTRTVGISPKVTASSLIGLAFGVAVALLNAVQNAQLLGPLPAWAQVMLLAMIPPITTWCAGYAAPAATTITAPADE